MFGADLGRNLSTLASGAVISLLKKRNKVFIGDTTLRDGEQAPGASLNIEQKLTIAKELDLLGVDSIEAGFPASSKEDFEAVRLIARRVRRPLITALSRCKKEDIEITREAFKGSRRWGITLFLGTSPMLRKHSVNKSKDEVLSLIREAVTLAKKYTFNVTFGAEDATRTELDFLYRVYEEAIAAGAIAIGFPDTVGWLVPDQVNTLISGIRSNVKNISNALLATHFHNDLGLAVANSLAAIKSGANIVQCTVNGIGERAGNASLEEVVMALKTREDYYQVKVSINAERLFKTSQLVSEMTGMGISPNKPIVGSNVFATEAGIHQAALLKERRTYEIIKPEDVGQNGTKFILGRHSGKHALRDKLEKLGYRLKEGSDREVFNNIYGAFKDLAVTKKEISDEEIANIAESVLKGSDK